MRTVFQQVRVPRVLRRLCPAEEGGWEGRIRVSKPARESQQAAEKVGSGTYDTAVLPKLVTCICLVLYESDNDAFNAIIVINNIRSHQNSAHIEHAKALAKRKFFENTEVML